jgi:signal peptidase I
VGADQIEPVVSAQSSPATTIQPSPAPTSTLSLFLDKAIRMSREVFVILLVATVLSAIMTNLVFRSFTVPSGSMQHTVEEGDRIWVWLAADYKRGDAVVFRDDLDWLNKALPTPTWYGSIVRMVGFPVDERYHYLVKRLIGLPGDHVERLSGNLFVNGALLDEPYVYLSSNRSSFQSDFDLVVPQGRAFVLGDHRNDSADSLHHLCQDGPTSAFVPLTAIVGPVALVGPPLERLGPIGTPPSWASVPAATGQVPVEAIVRTACGLPS